MGRELAALRRAALILAAAVGCQPTGAYEIDTHARITVEAAKRSVVQPNSRTLQNLGLLKSKRGIGRSTQSLQALTGFEVQGFQHDASGDA